MMPAARHMLMQARFFLLIQQAWTMALVDLVFGGKPFLE